MSVVCNCTLPEVGPVRPETCRSLRILKYHCDGNEMCAFIGYMVTIVMNVFLHCLWEVLQDPVYSPDVSPCDYLMIPPVEPGTAWETICRQIENFNSGWAQCGAYYWII